MMVAGIQQGLQLFFCKLAEVWMIHCRGEASHLLGGPLVSGKTIDFFVRTHFNTSLLSYSTAEGRPQQGGLHDRHHLIYPER